MNAIPFVEGLCIGLATTLLIGPVFFTLLRASLGHGMHGGVSVALGIILSDIAVVGICTAGLSDQLERHISGPWMGSIAGVLLGMLGVYYVAKPQYNMEREQKLDHRGAMGLFVTGFLVNFLNPFVFAIWISLSFHAGNTYGHGLGQWMLLAGALVGILVTDLAKAFYAPRLRRLLTTAMLKKLHIGIGIVLLVFSIRMFLLAIGDGM